MRKFFFSLFIVLSLQGYSLTAPALQSPSNGASFARFDAFLSCASVAGAKGYQFDIDTVPTFNSINHKRDTNTYSYMYSPTLRLNRTYYWRARAYAPGDTSAWSGNYSFSAINGTTALLQPANNSTGAIVNFFASATSSLPVITYQFELDTAANLSSSKKKIIFKSISYFDDSVLFNFGQAVYWRARSYNNLGDTITWSPTFKYTFHQAPILNASTTLFMVDPKIFPNWTNAGISSIELQLDSSQAFNTSRLQTKILAPGIIQDSFSNLFFGKYYFYRIRALYKGRASQWSITQAIQVYANGNITGPTNGSTVFGLTTNLAGRQLKGTKIQFILFADSAETIVLKDTLTSVSSYPYKGQFKLNKWYHFKMRYLHDLDTAAWLTSHFKTYTGQLNLGSPSFNSTKVAVRPRFNFRKQTWGTSHVMEIDTGSVFTSVRSSHFIQMVDSFKYDGSFYHYLDTTLLYAQKYVWRVYAIMGNDTAEATTSTFTTALAPTNYFPQNNFIGTGPSTNGLATGIAGSSLIQWELDTTLNFNSPKYLTGTDAHVPDDFTPAYVGLNFNPDLDFESKYFWRARCINVVDTSNWSTPFNFTTTQQVWLSTPANASTNLALNQTLTWGVQGSVSELRYQYQLSPDSNFVGATITTLAANTSPSANVSCQYSTKYYWRARAFHTKDTSNWSQVNWFSTLNAPVVGIPQLLSPANATINIPVGPVIVGWANSSNATSYDVQIGNDADFTNILASGNALGTASQFSGGVARARYYWRVRGRNGNVTSNWSVVRWFEFGAPASIEGQDLKNLIRIYPNPASQSFKVDLEGEFILKVYDIKGKLILDTKGTNSTEINSYTWQPGIYFLNLSKGTQFYIQKMVIQ
jgi:hypothetical protein